MSRHGSETYLLPGELSEADVLECSGRQFTVALESNTVSKRTYFDTFDWRLFRHGWMLELREHKLALRRLPHESLIVSLPWTAAHDPGFAWDLPDGALKDQLAPVMSTRALKVVANVHRHSRRHTLCNKDHKVVARLEVNVMRLLGGRANDDLALVTTIPVRGYLKELRRVAKLLGAEGISAARKSPFEEAVKMSGHDPGGYSSRLRVDFTADESAQSGVRKVLDELRQTMERNREGMSADLDTEYLHDFRVAIRRTRTALSEIKGVFPKQDIKSFKTEFAHFGKLTNRLRDLDVHLLNPERFEVMLPEWLRPGLSPLFDSMQEERNREHHRVVGALNGARYSTAMRNWAAFLHDTQDHSAQRSNAPLPDVARTLIVRKYRAIVKDGSKIGRSTPDESLHALRIQSKHLRYLLEFFFTLFPARKIAALVGQLRRLQDNLGDFNDCCVQLEMLRRALARQPGESESAAIGGLVAALHQRRQEIRMAFFETFTTFRSQSNRKAFHRLFGG